MKQKKLTTKNPNRLVELLISDLRDDIEVLHKTKMNVSSKTTHLLQYIVDEHMRHIKQIYTRSNMPVPDWVEG